MDAISNRALESLGPYPVLQGVVGVLVILACVYVAVRASRDKPIPPQNIPQHFLVGPLHDAFEDIRDLAEQSRQQTELLRRLDADVDKMARQTEITKATLEAIRNESRLR